MAGKESRSAGDLFQLKIAERLLEARTILIVGEITSRLAQQVTAQLLAMASDSDDDITIFLHSEGDTSGWGTFHSLLAANFTVTAPIHPRSGNAFPTSSGRLC